MASSDARRQRRAWKKYVAKNQKALMANYFKKITSEEVSLMSQSPVEDLEAALKQEVTLTTNYEAHAEDK